MDLTTLPKFKVRKINGNSAAHGHYKYQVRCISYETRVDDYLDIQTWAWENFGPSMDYEFMYYVNINESRHYNTGWCYQTSLKERKYCIYLNEAELTAFSLRWL